MTDAHTTSDPTLSAPGRHRGSATAGPGPSDVTGGTVEPGTGSAADVPVHTSSPDSPRRGRLPHLRMADRLRLPHVAWLASIAVAVAVTAAIVSATGGYLVVGGQNRARGGTVVTLGSNRTALQITNNGQGRGLIVATRFSAAGTFTSNRAVGVLGATANSRGPAVVGENRASTFRNGAAMEARGGQNNGLVATTKAAPAAAVRATTSHPDGTAMRAEAGAGNGVALSVESQGADLIRGTTPKARGAVFTVGESGRVETASGVTCGAIGDCLVTRATGVAEQVVTVEPIQPGDVLEIDPATGDLRRSRTYASTAVAGVAIRAAAVRSGAGVGTPERRALLALAGRVRVKASAAFGPIRPGDLLVAAPGGVAGRSTGTTGVGTVIGKALQPLAGGTGQILMLVMPG